ncbi:uncharacterized protein LAESUDRAFT_730733 [Laetiporus sulphureus 93-53]|uniref:DUF829-domain-containing protein n=1 Tax=Laetiporus sulphureus 93-53 TaxID=1314785 RepID=A0A165C1B4_9APHY|nr:uncharacterized protein LAESUDRAFT_730733 [Laetiporus sulphureus 93-53]KZT02020.1 hypothetical protein LAESUDRAFT_730733 [Laetiporus sulphureus 93-53]
MAPPARNNTHPSPFTKLNSHVSLLRPLQTEHVDPTHPSLILLFGWTDAQLPHLQKYVDPLMSMFPAATLVLIQATTSWYFTSEKRLEATLAPVVDILKGEVAKGSHFGGILVHVFSNGGSLQLVTLRKALARTPTAIGHDAQNIHSTTALVLDSTPAEKGLSSAIKSWGPPNPILHIMAIPPIALLYAAFNAVNTFICGNPPVFEEMRTTLNSVDLLPSITNPTDPKATPRLYICSDADKVTPQEEVLTHYEEALTKGFDVTVEKFAGSPHVAHARSDPERYWNAIRRLWAKAVTSSRPVSSIT